MRRAALIAAVALAAGPAAGCAYHVRLTATPEVASVTLPDDGGTVTTPAVVDLRWAPFRDQVVTVRAPGYRALTVDLRDHGMKGSHLLWRRLRPGVWGEGVDGHVGFVLIPNHGPAGTWAPEDVP